MAGTKDQLYTYFQELFRELHYKPEEFRWEVGDDERYVLLQRVVARIASFNACRIAFEEARNMDMGVL